MHEGDQLRVFKCMMVTNCTGELFFSRLKLIKNQLRSIMGQHCLNWLSLMCMKNDILKTIDFKPIIKQLQRNAANACNNKKFLVISYCTSDLHGSLSSSVFLKPHVLF